MPGMRKKVILVGGGFASICAAAFLLPIEVRWWWFGAFAFIGCLLFGGLLVNRILRKEFIAKNPFTDDRRNFDILVLGSTYAWLKVSESRYNIGQENRVISYSFYRRSLFAANLILRRICGLLRAGGAVVFIYRYEELQEHALSIADVALLHPVTLREIGIRREEEMLKRVHRLLEDVKYSAGYFTERFLKRRQTREEWKTAGVQEPSISQDFIENSSLILEDIAAFCAKKGLKCHVLLIGKAPTGAEVRIRDLGDSEVARSVTFSECRDMSDCNAAIEGIMDLG